MSDIADYIEFDPSGNIIRTKRHIPDACNFVDWFGYSFYNQPKDSIEVNIFKDFAMLKKKVYEHVNRAYIAKAQHLYNEAWVNRTSPKQGDKILLKTGELLSVSVDHYSDETFQAGHGSIFLYSEGGMSFSGSCGDCYEVKNFKKSLNKAVQKVWTFDRGNAQENNGVNFEITVGIWEEV